MTTMTLAPSPVMQVVDNAGTPGKLFTYSAGTTTKLSTYTDSTGGTPNANPLFANARGEVQVWIPPNVAYKFTASPANDTDPPTASVWTVDQMVNSQLTTLYGGVDTGAVNAYVLTFSANFTSYVDGSIIYWVPSHTNTGPSTLNINGIGVANIVYVSGAALFGGELTAGQIAQVIISGGQFLLISTTIQSGSFAPAWFGFAVAPTGNMNWQLTGNQVTLNWTGTTGTSNSTSMSIGNVPLLLRPAASASDKAMVACSLIDNNTSLIGGMGFTGLSTWQFSMGSPLSVTGFNGGAVVKGLPGHWSVTYLKG